MVELDGYANHHHRRAFQTDRTKANDLTAAGYTVLRPPGGDVTERPADVAGRISRASESAAPLRRSGSSGVVSEMRKKPSPLGPYAPPGESTTAASSSTCSQYAADELKPSGTGAHT